MRLPHTVWLDGEQLWQWRRTALVEAACANIDQAEVDWLIQAICNVDSLALRLETFRQRQQIPSHLSLETLQDLWEKRIQQRLPVQYLVGQTQWRDLTIQVSPAVLIPRPETELIIDLVRQKLLSNTISSHLQRGTWVDLGTGSGVIALGLAKILPEAHILAVDVSTAALAIAQENAVLNKLQQRIQFIQGSWFEPLGDWKGQLAGIVSNPPYIPKAIVQTLAPEVRDHEPTLALEGGVDGYEALRILIKTGADYLQSDGIWLAEMMAGQATMVQRLLDQQGTYKAIQIFSDLAGIERFAMAQRC